MDFINLVVPQPPGTSDWALLEKCVERLMPIVDATNDVEADAAILETVTRHIDILLATSRTSTHSTLRPCSPLSTGAGSTFQPPLTSWHMLSTLTLICLCGMQRTATK
eukprot:GGOE01002956.1.p2 GENE.GGOE01002956.1~~GGOE01002956.1.p2  ORF type:complete len:108 (+),score=12.08 GGOE01002956.1:47-370(+)